VRSQAPEASLYTDMLACTHNFAYPRAASGLVVVDLPMPVTVNLPLPMIVNLPVPKCVYSFIVPRSGFVDSPALVYPPNLC
jgi:hypothetical protein